jgi:hypothetical protein
MTPREQQQRKAALKSGIQSARERMTNALATMDYETALACQVEINELKREARLRERRHDVDLRRASSVR